MGSRYRLRLTEKVVVFKVTRNELQAQFFWAALRGLSTGNDLFTDSRICRGAVSGTRCVNQVRYFAYNRQILGSQGKIVCRVQPMPTLLVAAPPDAPRASERRYYEYKQPSRLYTISSRDQDADRPFAGPECQDGVRCRYRPTPGMFRPTVRPSPVGEDHRQNCSILRTPDRCNNKRLRPYRVVKTMMQQAIFSILSNRP